MLDVVSYLENKGVVLREGGQSNHRTHCFFCGEDESKPGRLYINTDPESPQYGLYTCFVCETKGNLNTLRKHFGDAPLDDSPSALEQRILDSATEYYFQALLENDEVFEYLTDVRGLSLDVIVKRRLGWANGGLVTHLLKSFELDDIKATGLVSSFGKDFFRGRITIPYFEYGAVVTIRGRDFDGMSGNVKYLGLPGVGSRIYGLDQIRGSDTILIAAGELDQIVLSEQGYAAIGVPGERIWKKPDWDVEVQDARRIYIVFDGDKAGREGAEKLSAHIGPRSRVVCLPDRTDIGEFFTSKGKCKEDLDFLISKAKGGLLASPAQAYERWLEVEGNPNLAGLKFNIEELDRELRHGILPGQVVVLLSRTSTGKTVFSLNILQRMRMNKPDIKILLLSLEQTQNEWFERAHRQHSFYYPHATPMDTVKFWGDNLFIVDKNRLTAAELEITVDQFNFETGKYPDLIVVDYLGYYARSYQGEEYSRMASAIMDIKGIAKETQSAILAPHQANRSNDMGSEVRLDQAQGASQVEQTADLLLAMWNPDQKGGLERNEYRRELVLKVQKSRDGGVGSQFKMQMAPLTLAIVPQSDQNYARAIWERNQWAAHSTYEDVIEMYRNKATDMRID